MAVSRVKSNTDIPKDATEVTFAVRKVFWFIFLRFLCVFG